MEITLSVDSDHKDQFKQDTSPSTQVDAQVPLIGK